METLQEKVIEAVRAEGSTKAAARRLNREGIKTNSGERFTWARVRGYLASHSRLKNGHVAAAATTTTVRAPTNIETKIIDVLRSNLARETKRTIVKEMADLI